MQTAVMVGKLLGTIGLLAAFVAQDAKNDDPGALNDKACQAVVVAQYGYNGVKPDDVKVEYLGTQGMDDGGMNLYRVTVNGKKWLAVVALRIRPDTGELDAKPDAKPTQNGV